MGRTNDNLKAEYLQIQGQYEAFDQRALSMKALATPLLGAGLAFGVKEHSDIVVYATTAVALSLWVLEAIWKGFQHCFASRIEVLEDWFRGTGPDDEAPFQIYRAWTESYARTGLTATLRQMAQPFVFLPYLVVMLVGMAIIST